MRAADVGGKVRESRGLAIFFAFGGTVLAGWLNGDVGV